MQTAFDKRKLKTIRVHWLETDDVDFPFAADVEGERWRLRINDFPEEPLMTLFVGEEEIGHMDDFPPHWSRSGH